MGRLSIMGWKVRDMIQPPQMVQHFLCTLDTIYNKKTILSRIINRVAEGQVKKV